MQITSKFLKPILLLTTICLLAGCTATSTATVTPTAVSQPTADRITVGSAPEALTITPTQNKTPVPSITVNAQAELMKKDMKDLAAQRLVSSSEGTYYRVQDFTGEWAKLSYYHWWPLNRKPTNFAIRADVDWKSALPIGNPSKSGCGFVFHENGADNLHFSFISMDGYARNYRVEKKVFSDLKANYVGKFNYPGDSAKIMLVVDYQWITFFVNGKQIVRLQDDRLKGGGLAFAVASGANNDFGTRCTFTNVELWEFN